MIKIIVIISLWGLTVGVGVYGYLRGKLSGTVFWICLAAFILGCIIAANNIRRIRKAEKAEKEDY